MTFYCAYVNEVVQWKAIPLPVTFLVSYLLDKSLKSHSVLGLIPSCHFRSPDSFLLPCRLPALICCQTILTLSDVALRLTSCFSDCSLLCLFLSLQLLFALYFYLQSDPPFAPFLCPFPRCRLSRGLGVPQGVGYVVLDQLHHLNHHPPHRGSEPLGRC